MRTGTAMVTPGWTRKLPLPLKGRPATETVPIAPVDATRNCSLLSVEPTRLPAMVTVWTAERPAAARASGLPR